MITVTLPYDEYEKLKEELNYYKSNYTSEYIHRNHLQNDIIFLEKELDKYKSKDKSI